MRGNFLLATLLLALLSLALAMPFAWLTNHLLGFEGFSIARGLWLNLAFGALILLFIGVPLANAYRRRVARNLARPSALPTQATVVSVNEVPVQSKRLGVRMTLDVSMPGGGTQRLESGLWLVRKVDRPRLASGASLDVKVDPARPQHVFPNCDWLAESQSQ
jgi:hypothetical protein